MDDKKARIAMIKDLSADIENKMFQPNAEI